MEKLSAKLPGSLQFGKDGVSPVVKIEKIADGHRITITDVNGEITFDVPDGQDGKSAYDYAVEAGYTGDSSTFANALVKALTSKVVMTINGSTPDVDGDVQVPAVLYTEQKLSEEQQAQARENIGADTFVRIDCTLADDGTATVSKTFDEIQSIIDSGKIPYVRTEYYGTVACAYFDGNGLHQDYETGRTAISFSCDGILALVWPDETVEIEIRRLLNSDDLVQETINFVTPDVPPSALAVAEYVESKLGDISTALDELHAYAEALKGGDSE